LFWQFPIRPSPHANPVLSQNTPGLFVPFGLPRSVLFGWTSGFAAEGPCRPLQMKSTCHKHIEWHRERYLASARRRTKHVSTAVFDCNRGRELVTAALFIAGLAESAFRYSSPCHSLERLDENRRIDSLHIATRSRKAKSGPCAQNLRPNSHGRCWQMSSPLEDFAVYIPHSGTSKPVPVAFGGMTSSSTPPEDVANTYLSQNLHHTRPAKSEHSRCEDGKFRPDLQYQQ
jgi:hypothetical protein